MRYIYGNDALLKSRSRSLVIELVRDTIKTDNWYEFGGNPLKSSQVIAFTSMKCHFVVFPMANHRHDLEKEVKVTGDRTRPRYGQDA